MRVRAEFSYKSQHEIDVLRGGRPPEFVSLLTYLFSEVLDGRNADLTDGVGRALGRRPRDFREYATQVARIGIWNARPAVSRVP